jgi:hypothetical protein
MIEFARKNDKPVFIAEASPTISDYTAKFVSKEKYIHASPNLYSELGADKL